MSKPTIIYGLYSSRNGELRYVGQTTQGLKTRLIQHRNYAKTKRTPVHNWIARELSAGFQIEIKSLCDEAIFNVTELEFIAKHRAAGARLLNLTDGGEGTLGWHGGKGIPKPWMAEQNRKRCAGRPGHPMSAENKAKLVAALTGKKRPELVLRNKTNNPWIGHKHSEETKAKIGAAHIGKTVSADARRKIGDANRGRKLTPEAVAKLRAAHRAYYERRAHEAA